MGQYHKTVNLDKKQYINHRKLGDGAKLLEQCGWSPGGTNDALHLLLAVSSGRGGGDFQSDSPLIGSWGGDRIAVIGDYAEADDLPNEDAWHVYDQCDDEGTFTDITDELIPIMEREYECVYVDRGYVQRIQFSDIEGYAGSHGRGDRHIMIRMESGDNEFKSSTVREAIRKYGSTASEWIDGIDPKLLDLGQSVKISR